MKKSPARAAAKRAARLRSGCARPAAKANEFDNVLHLGGTLDKQLFEIVVLTIARHWRADYEWFAHEKNALKAGLPASVIEAIRRSSFAEFATGDRKLVYEIIRELNETKRLGNLWARSASIR